MKKYLLILFVLNGFTPASAGEPRFEPLVDSCFRYLEAGDTLRFNRSFSGLLDAYEQSEDPENHALRSELLAMRNEDQGIRILLLEAYKRFGKESPRTQAVRDRMKRIDNTNAARIQAIIDEKGWPTKANIGEDAAETVFLCIQHVNDLSVQEKYLPLLERLVREGEEEGWHYAFLVDRIRMNRGERQVYGTQTVSRSNGELDYIVPLEHPEQADSLRRSVGLESLNDYLDGAWNLETYKRELPAIEQKYKAFVEKRNLPKLK